MAKGYRGRNKNVFRVAVEKVEKALQYAYRDRRAKKEKLPFSVDSAHQRRNPSA